MFIKPGSQEQINVFFRDTEINTKGKLVELELVALGSGKLVLTGLKTVTFITNHVSIWFFQYIAGKKMKGHGSVRIGKMMTK
jgi:hypothetical protein